MTDFYLEAAHVGDCEHYIPHHTHPAIEWVWLERGRCIVLAEGFGRLKMEAGEVCIMPALLPHSQSSSPGGETVFALLQAKSSGGDAYPGIVHCRADPLLRSWFYQLVNLHEEESGKSAIPFLLAAIRARLDDWEAAAEPSCPPSPALAVAVEYLNRSFRRPDCTVAAAAEAAGISAGHLNSLFRRHLHGAPIRYLNERRLAFACRLLKNPYWTIAEIAGKSGFADPAYFCRKFKLRYGITPGALRAGECPEREIRDAEPPGTFPPE